MKNFAPDIYRQRLIVEGIYTCELLEASDLNVFLMELADKLKMTIVFGPHVMNLAGEINPKHAGFEAITIWSESGCQLYTWNRNNFFTCDIYSCKKFDVKETVDFIRDFFMAQEIEYREV